MKHLVGTRLERGGGCGGGLGHQRAGLVGQGWLVVIGTERGQILGLEVRRDRLGRDDPGQDRLTGTRADRALCDA